MQLLLNGPVSVMLWRLAGPNVVAVAMFTSVMFADAWYIGQVGTVALASLALVFPFQTLIQMMAAERSVAVSHLLWRELWAEAMSQKQKGSHGMRLS